MHAFEKPKRSFSARAEPHSRTSQPEQGQTERGLPWSEEEFARDEVWAAPARAQAAFTSVQRKRETGETRVEGVEGREQDLRELQKVRALQQRVQQVSTPRQMVDAIRQRQFWLRGRGLPLAAMHKYLERLFDKIISTLNL